MKANKGLLSSGKFMDFGLFKKIIDEGAALGLKAIKPNAGDSEPLLVRNLAEYVGYAKDKGILEIMINTNATLLTPKKSKDLIVAGLDRLLVSFDSPNKEKYEQIRVGASFDNVVRNLNQFIEIRGESLLPILRLSMVRMKDNEAEVDDFIKMWKDKADLLAVLDYQNPRNMDSISRSDYQQEINWDFACAQLWQRLQIRVDGTVTPCCGDYLNELKLGNANDNSISSLWLGERLKTLRELHITKKFYKIPTCYYCGFVRLPR
jgi:radical SAM protein with 4Fe4S-binding SPASM domain